MTALSFLLEPLPLGVFCFLAMMMIIRQSGELKDESAN